MIDLEAKIAAALDVLAQAKGRSARQLIAYSGGKDSLVVTHLAGLVGITNALCEGSFYFSEQLRDIKLRAARTKLNCHFSNRLDLQWLRKHPQVIFSNSAQVRAWSFSVRHQAAVKEYAKLYGFDCQIFGRRTQENSVPSEIYTTKAGLQCHPIRDWTEDDVWEYLRRVGIDKPWIYRTRFGLIEGNAPFYTIRERDLGGIDRAWELVESLDNNYSREAILGY